MFGELPKLFDKNFVASFVFPATLFLGLLIWLMQEFGISIAIVSRTGIDPLLGTTITAVSSWFSGIILAILNREIIRFFEGYGYFNPLRILWFSQFLHFNFLQHKRELLLDKLDDNGLTDNEQKKLNNISVTLTEKFPESNKKLLPTTFGNTIKSFEEYSRIIYGFEAINGWDRLQAVIPKSYRELINDAKVRTDFWVNIRILILLLLVLYIVIAIINQQTPVIWFVILLICVYLIAGNRSVSAAIDWGEMVKSSFDVYLPDLREKLGYEVFDSQEDERAFWVKFSQVMVYRRPDVMDSLYKLKRTRKLKSSHYNRIMRAKNRN